MFQVKIPREIKNYKEKIVMGMTIRQMLSVGTALAVCIPTYYYGRRYMSADLLSWIIIAIALILGGIGYYQKDGMPMEKYLFIMIKYTFFSEHKRKYRSTSIQERLIWQEYQETWRQFQALNKKKGK